MCKMLKVAITIFIMFVSSSAYADSPMIQNPDNGHWYQRFDNTMSWHDAKAYGESLGGYLATITSQEENDFIYSNLATTSPQVPWLGATDEVEEGVWRWVTGETWSYTNWYPGEPNNFCEEDYLHFTAGNNFWEQGTNGWNDLQTRDNGGSICGGNVIFASTIIEWDDIPDFVPDVSGCITLQGSSIVNRKVILKQPLEPDQSTTTDANGCYKFDNAVSGKTFKVIIKGTKVP